MKTQKHLERADVIGYKYIAKFVAKECHRIGAKRILLLGTRRLMNNGVIDVYLKKQGIEVINTVNYPEEIIEIDNIIDDVRHDEISFEDKEFLINFIYQFPCDSQVEPDAVVFAAPELSELIYEEDIEFPLISAEKAHIGEIIRQYS